ncbi:SDR family NAD(P)-dependent oxidoreductase [Terricaulis silvestris]|uniref:D-xylose 1-dehydrogenase n=1 Tax=Terricaulis silvestris TaxID=2686094 RepID=A0A6I6MGC9_9CAUL|nr:SDR family oxidoreductase [Terricaulis silvestris]QGZ93660.1 putative oxidoreductase YghA [Terricaulis silvestris]
MRLASKIGIVTGAGAGIGRAGALRFAAEGAAIAIVDIDKVKVDAVQLEVTEAGGKAIGLAGDLCDEAFARSIVPQTQAALGGLDFLWNHAGTVGPKDIEDVDYEALERAIQLNLRAGILATEAAIPLLRPRRGNVLFTSSVSGLIASQLSFTYSMTKFGVVGLMRALAKRYAADGVRFNAICPGPVATDMQAASMATMKPVNIPAGRLGRPEEVAAAALFLVSDEASFVTGVALPVDGGYIA